MHVAKKDAQKNEIVANTNAIKNVALISIMRVRCRVILIYPVANINVTKHVIRDGASVAIVHRSLSCTVNVAQTLFIRPFHADRRSRHAIDRAAERIHANIRCSIRVIRQRHVRRVWHSQRFIVMANMSNAKRFRAVKVNFRAV